MGKVKTGFFQTVKRFVNIEAVKLAFANAVNADRKKRNAVYKRRSVFAQRNFRGRRRVSNKKIAR